MGQTRVRQANFLPFESASKNSAYARITRNMVKSRAWQELNTFEQVLYLHLKLKYKPGSEKDLSFTYKEGEKLMSKRTFTKSIDKLIAVGLVDLIRHAPYSQACNIYGLSDRWHDYGTVDFRDKKRPKRKQK